MMCYRDSEFCNIPLKSVKIFFSQQLTYWWIILNLRMFAFTLCWGKSTFGFAPRSRIYLLVIGYRVFS